jgi:hypothetical protein
MESDGLIDQRKDLFRRRCEWKYRQNPDERRGFPDDCNRLRFTAKINARLLQAVRKLLTPVCFPAETEASIHDFFCCIC